MFYFSIALVIGSLFWFYSSPDWEPALFFLSSLGGAIFAKKDRSTPKFQGMKEKYVSLVSKKALIDKENELLLSDEELDRILSSAILNGSSKIKFKNVYANEIIQYANKKEKDIDKAHSLKNYANSLNENLNLVNTGFDLLTWLVRKKHLNLPVSQVSKVFRKLIKMIYQPAVVPNGHRKLDIYRRWKGTGELHYPIWINNVQFDDLVTHVNKQFKSEGTELLKIPYNFNVIDMPEALINSDIVPAHIYFSMTRYPEYKDNDEYWAYFSWYFGLG